MKKSRSEPAMQSTDRPSRQTQELSIQAQLELNDVPEYANEPGPGHYFGPESEHFSGFKRRIPKTQDNPNPYGIFHDKLIQFPTTGWPNWKKVIISKGHEGAYKLRDSPGCAYQVPESSVAVLQGFYHREPHEPPPPVLTQAGNKKTFLDLRYFDTMGKSQRPDLALSLGMNPKGSPGPATYPIPKDEKKEKEKEKEKKVYGQMDSKSERFENRTHKGPGPYSRKDVALNPSTGKSFGCPRSSYDKVIRPGWEKDGQCQTASKIGTDADIPPGVSNYVFDDRNGWKEKTYDILVNGEWKEKKYTMQDGKSKSRAFSIGTAPRFPKDRVSAAAPGPGQYKRDETDIAKCTFKQAPPDIHPDDPPIYQGSIVSNARNPGGLGLVPSFGKKPRKPRFRQMLALNTASRAGWGYF